MLELKQESKAYFEKVLKYKLERDVEEDGCGEVLDP